jgi:hypothetical protein
MLTSTPTPLSSDIREGYCCCVQPPEQRLRNLLAQDSDWPFPKFLEGMKSLRWSHMQTKEVATRLTTVLEAVNQFVTAYHNVLDVAQRLSVCGPPRR